MSEADLRGLCGIIPSDSRDHGGRSAKRQIGLVERKGAGDISITKRRHPAPV